MNISVLGCGRWATFLAWYADSIEHNVMIWGRQNSSNLKTLRQDRKNEYLSLTESMQITDNLQEAVSHADYIIVSISSQHLRDLCQKLKQIDLSGKHLILAMKGVEKSTGKRLSQVVEEELDIPLAVWVGPGHVQAFTQGIPNCMIISSKDKELTEKVIDIFNSDLIRLYISQDLLGVEIGAASKNVVGLAAGMLDGLGYDSLKGALIARGSREMARLVKAMGGDELTIYGLSHIGDYEATLFSPFSNNRRFGEAFIKGQSFGKLAEGVATTESLLKLAEEYQVQMPISQAVYDCILAKKDPKELLSNLFLRDIKREFE